MAEGSPEWEERAKASRASFDLAELHLEMGQFADAERHYRQALAMERELGDRFGEAANLHGLGVACGRQGRTAEARYLLEAALRMNRENEDPGEEGMTLVRLAEVAKQQGDDGRRMELLLEAIDCFGRVKEWRLLYHTLSKVALAAPQSPARPGLQAVWLGMQVEAPGQHKAEVALVAIAEGRLDLAISWRLAAYAAWLEAEAGGTASGEPGRGFGALTLQRCAEENGVRSPEAFEAWIAREGLRDPERLIPALKHDIENTVPKREWRFSRAAALGKHYEG